MKYRLFLLAVLLALVTTSAHATTYYVNNQGNDKWPGTSPSQPWQTIDRVNTQNLNINDHVLFKGGQTFVGSIYLSPSDTGTRANPVLLSVYGTGQAWISSGAAFGLFGYNVSGITVSNLHFLGGGSTNTADGVSFYTDAPGGSEGITLTSVDVSGYGRSGIAIGSWNTPSGYRHIDIETSLLQYNADGLLLYAQYPNTNQDVFVDTVTASHNARSGLALSGVAGGTIQFSQAYDNAVGVLVYDSTQIILHNSVAHHNQVGFDFDANVSLSTIQFSTAYQNDGAGYLFSSPFLDDTHTDNTLQNNVSTNDSRTGSYGAIQTWGRLRNVVIRNNVIAMTPGASPYTAALTLANWGFPSHCIDNMIVRGNVFKSTSHLLIATSDILQCSTRVHFLENVYQGNPFSILWGPTNYTSLMAWTAATGQH